MTKPTIRDYMTPSPVTIGDEQPLDVAAQRMREHKIRHLPVLRAGQLVGIISERDVQLVSGLPSVDPHALKVEDAMSDSVYAVSPDTPLDEVAAHMAAHKYGAALVTENGKVSGVFTTIDALYAITSGAPTAPHHASPRH
jgi:acetoin utilization protein AcuB